MALLLRMGGVPARVATGFTTGTLDKGSGEYVVHDYDAHSWVEAWFPDYGWVTLDPTPQASPALRGLRDGSRVPVSAEAGDPARRPGQASPPSDGGNVNGNSGTQLGFLAWIVLAAVVVGLAALLLVGRR